MKCNLQSKIPHKGIFFEGYSILCSHYQSFNEDAFDQIISVLLLTLENKKA